mmetsp:Transcript_30633/g.81469  ORF Transcript_30633/g.81469 Transcript_30633/m.81469 type:complete len:222 (+) Transcript_30633:191-856(+)
MAARALAQITAMEGEEGEEATFVMGNVANPTKYNKYHHRIYAALEGLPRNDMARMAAASETDDGVFFLSEAKWIKFASALPKTHLHRISPRSPASPRTSPTASWRLARTSRSARCASATTPPSRSPNSISGTSRWTARSALPAALSATRCTSSLPRLSCLPSSSRRATTFKHTHHPPTPRALVCVGAGGRVVRNRARVRSCLCWVAGGNGGVESRVIPLLI